MIGRMKVKVMPGKMADFENTMWNVDMEVNLFHAMRRHKPVGVNRYFQMMFIHDKLNNSSSRKIASKHIWKHLSEMYDLQALNESEIIPFPNRETEFLLPAGEYHSLMEKSFPRIETDSTTLEDAKSEKSDGRGSKEGKGSSGEKNKNDSKSSSKGDSRGSSTPKDSRTESRGSTPHGKDRSDGKTGKDSKSDNKGSSTPHGKESKGDNKGSSTPHGGKGGKSSTSGGASAASTPESTPKRKRTRQANSTNASPATPSDSHPTKRGRR